MPEYSSAPGDLLTPSDTSQLRIFLIDLILTGGVQLKEAAQCLMLVQLTGPLLVRLLVE